MLQGPITPHKTSARKSKSIPAVISSTTYAANLKQWIQPTQEAYVKLGTSALTLALTADAHATALYIAMVRLNRAGDFEEYIIKKREFFQTLPGLMYQALSAEEQYRAVVKEMRLKQIRA